MSAVKRERWPWPLIVVDEQGIQGHPGCSVLELEELHTTTSVSIAFVFFRTRPR